MVSAFLRWLFHSRRVGTHATTSLFEPGAPARPEADPVTDRAYDENETSAPGKNRS